MPMIDTSHTSPLGLALAGLAGAAAIGLWLLPTPTVSDLSPRANAAAVPQATTAPDLSAITERPLFDRSRAPLVIAEPAPAPAPAAPTLALHGIMGDKSAPTGLTALMRLSNSDELFTLGLQGRVGEWTVEQIEANHVVVRDADGQTRSIYLLGTQP